MFWFRPRQWRGWVVGSHVTDRRPEEVDQGGRSVGGGLRERKVRGLLVLCLCGVTPGRNYFTDYVSVPCLGSTMSRAVGRVLLSPSSLWEPSGVTEVCFPVGVSAEVVNLLEGRSPVFSSGPGNSRFDYRRPTPRFFCRIPKQGKGSLRGLGLPQTRFYGISKGPPPLQWGLGGFSTRKVVPYHRPSQVCPSCLGSREHPLHLSQSLRRDL